MHIQVPPTPQQVICPVSETAEQSDDDPTDTEETTCIAKGSFLSEKSSSHR